MRSVSGCSEGRRWGCTPAHRASPLRRLLLQQRVSPSFACFTALRFRLRLQDFSKGSSLASRYESAMAVSGLQPWCAPRVRLCKLALRATIPKQLGESRPKLPLPGVTLSLSLSLS